MQDIIVESLPFQVHKMPLEYIANEIEEAKRYKRMQAEMQEVRPLIIPLELATPSRT